MKLSCLQENLNKGLTIVSRVITSKTQLPILGNILVTAEDNRLKLSVTNLEMGISFWLGAKIEEEGALAIPARIFTEMVSSLPPEKIDLQSEGGLLSVSCPGCKASLNSLSADEFPPLLAPSKKTKITLPLSLFIEAVSHVALAVAQDEGRPALTGVSWTSDQKTFILAATDGYRLSVRKIPGPAGAFGEGVIVPARALIEAAHIAQEREKRKEKEEIAIFFSSSEKQICFSFEDVEITSRLIEGEFPEFARIIPSGFTTRAILDKEALLRATRTAAIFARDSANIVRWKVGEGKLILSANSPQVGENVSEIGVKTEGEGGEIAFNFRFLLDFLGAVKSEEIIFEMSGPLNPGVFKLAGDDSLLHIIMPVRVQG